MGGTMKWRFELRIERRRDAEAAKRWRRQLDDARFRIRWARIEGCGVGRHQRIGATSFDNVLKALYPIENLR